MCFVYIKLLQRSMISKFCDKNIQKVSVLFEYFSDVECLMRIEVCRMFTDLFAFTMLQPVSSSPFPGEDLHNQSYKVAGVQHFTALQCLRTCWSLICIPLKFIYIFLQCVELNDGEPMHNTSLISPSNSNNKRNTFKTG